MAFVYLGLGTNIGNKHKNLNDAIIALSLETGDVLAVSSFYAMKAWGFESENEFLNAVILVQTQCNPFELLEITQNIETKLGREKKTKSDYADRIIDIDILMYDNLIINDPKLKIPHPLITKRDFVLIPLTEIAPELVHPLLEKKMSAFLKTN